MEIPAYFKIANELRKRIFDGELNPGDLLPSENDLAAMFDSSRITTRKSLSILENEGLVYALHGKGYYVQTPEHNKYTMYFKDYDDDLDIKIQYITVIPTSDELIKSLSLKTGQRIILIRRILLKEDKPIACDEKYIPYHKGAPFVETEIKYAEFPDIVAAKTSPFAFRTEMEVGAEAAKGEIAELLVCPPEEPLLVVYRYIIDINGTRVGFEKTFILKEYGRLKAHSGYISSKGWEFFPIKHINR